ncbi:MAG TPA: HAMP domain-containing sensor histidine kinase [Dyadobacter sp.]|jgi:signal transduction histidine kinase|nr:HAMP domain-containing sensor histidine kinase [Dyadobacter sp.]
MSLLNYTLKYLAFALLGIISVWAVVFYVNMLDEVYDSLDDGLDNFKMLIIEKASQDSTILLRNEFAEGNYEIREIPKDYAKKLRDVHKDTLMYMPFEDDLEPVRMLTTAFKKHDQYYELKIISSMVEEDDLIEDLFYALIWLYVALIVSILIVNNLLLRKVWKPFYGLVDQLKDFRLGINKPISAVDTEVKEFRILNDSVIALTQHTTDTFNSQKQFIENASHELQTPVAISINRLELLAERGALTEPDMEIVGRVIQTLERLTRLNKSLLLLSKIENRQFEQGELVSANTMFKDIVNELQDFADYKEVQINIEEKAQLNFSIPKDLAVILLSNLLRNAIIHNKEGGTVKIKIQQNHFSIANTGSASALDDKRVFRRFEKSSSDKNNTGLGLAIVKAITDICGATIVYKFDGKHTMTVSF